MRRALPVLALAAAANRRAAAQILFPPDSTFTVAEPDDEGPMIAGTCEMHGECRAGYYCDQWENCYRCDYITPTMCDAMPLAGSSSADDHCCSGPFRRQCTADPAQCDGPPSAASRGSDATSSGGGAATVGTAPTFTFGGGGGERGGCPTSDWEYASETVTRGMRSCADLRDQGECWTPLSQLVGREDPNHYEVAELCPCCYEDESSFAVAGFGSEPASLRAAESCSTDAFYTQCCKCSRSLCIFFRKSSKQRLHRRDVRRGRRARRFVRAVRRVRPSDHWRPVLHRRVWMHVPRVLAVGRGLVREGQQPQLRRRGLVRQHAA